MCRRCSRARSCSRRARRRRSQLTRALDGALVPWNSHACEAVMDLELRGRKAIITGATKGIGLRIARLFADEGADVGICARTAADVETTVAELKAKGVNACGQAVDVTDRDQYVGWIEACAR